MPPPSAASAEKLTSRLLLGPALRTQSDRRLVTLVREGYEAAFEEIVRRYRTQLDRFAAAIVDGHSEDVTQDALSKALLALRGSETEIELRPWLYRIVRNTALNDLRDSPPPTDELVESLAAGRSAAEEAERREELTEVMERLRALPDQQRAAIVMRELEGLSHEEIAAGLGLSGGAARQAIYRGRQALRDGLGLLLPLPLVRALIDHGAEAAGAGGAVAGAGAAAGAAGAAGGTGAALGGVGVGGALKVGVATALIAGSVGAGVAVEQRSDHSNEGPAAAETPHGDRGAPSGSQIVASGSGPSTTAGPSGGERDDGRGSNDNGGARQESGGGGEDHGRGSGDDGEAVGVGIPGDDRGLDHGGPGPHHGSTRHGPGGGGHDDGSGLDGRGPRLGGDGGDGSGHSGSGPGPRPPSLSGGSDSGRGGSGHSGGGGGGPSSEGGGSGSGTSGDSGRDGSGSGGGSGPSAEPPPEAPPPLPEGESGDLRDGSENDS